MLTRYLASCFLSAASMLLIAAVAATGCTQVSGQNASDSATDNAPAADVLMLPELQSLEADDQPLRVIATTSIIGDVVAHVGGNNIELTTLINAGSDPHSYQPAPRDLAAVAEADVIFVNGWNLEESLVDNLQNVAENATLVPVSANIRPLVVGQIDEHDSADIADPHVWLSVTNVKQWVENIESVLSDLNPENAETYRDNAAVYLAELDRLEQDTVGALAVLPQERRFLVTNHDSLAYFADAYGFTIVGTVIPGGSTIAEPSASDLAELVTQMNEHGVCAIIADTTASSTLAETVASELKDCQDVRVVQFYTGALGPRGSGADSYIDMFTTNVERIVEALQ